MIVFQITAALILVVYSIFLAVIFGIEVYDRFDSEESGARYHKHDGKPHKHGHLHTDKDGVTYS